MRRTSYFLALALAGALAACDGASGAAAGAWLNGGAPPPSAPFAPGSPSPLAQVAPAPASFPVRRCMNIGALEAPREGDWGYAVRAEDFVKLKAAGFDSVRLPVKFSAHAGLASPYRLDPAFMARIDEVIGQALGAGLAVILDLHHYEEMNDDPQGQLPRLVAIWDQLGERYRNHPPTLVFEVLNEPFGPKMTTAMVERINAAGLQAIRRTNPTRAVVVSGPRWGTVEGLDGFTAPADPNVIVTVHFYDPFDFTHENAIWMNPKPRFGRLWGEPRDQAHVKAQAALAAEWGVRHGKHIFLGEFGVNEEVRVEQRALWTRFTREAFEAHGMSWCHFDWATTFKTYDVPREAWVEPVRNALVPPR